MTDLEKMVRSEAAELKALYEGLDEEEMQRREDAGENMDLLDYINDALDTEYILDSMFTLIGVKLYVTLGGPTIWVDTQNNEVVGHWGTEQQTAWVPSEICEEINDLITENMADRDGCPF
ncbi:hypothetical protein [Gemmiger sp.]